VVKINKYHPSPTRSKQLELTCSGESSNTTSDKNIFKCYRCGKIGHNKRCCQTKLQESKIVDTIVEEEDWESVLWQKQNLWM